MAVATYDATDQLLTEGPQGGTLTSFNYDPYGNLTTSAETFNSGTTAYTYDLGDRLTKITPPVSMASAQSFTLDALGRINTETAGSTTTTLAYVGTSKTVSRLATGATNVDSLLGADGSRLATLSGSSFGWLTPDLHGDVAGASNSSFGTISDALRYDAFGTISALATSALPTPWRYQGQLLVNPAGASDLYAAGTRFYAPGLGAFTQLDTTQGGALNPLSMNRFVYAEANPETFTDPSGHTVVDTGDAYNTTITNDATHKHVVRTHLSGRQMYPGLNWKRINVERAAEHKARVADAAAGRRNLAHVGLAEELAQAAATNESMADQRNQDHVDFRVGELGRADCVGPVRRHEETNRGHSSVDQEVGENGRRRRVGRRWIEDRRRDRCPWARQRSRGTSASWSSDHSRRGYCGDGSLGRIGDATSRECKADYNRDPSGNSSRSPPELLVDSLHDPPPEPPRSAAVAILR